MRLSVFHHLAIATIIFVTILVIGILAITHFAILSGVETAEKEAAPGTAEKILAVLSLEGENLGRIAYDWGVWDDTYTFFADRNEQYISSNLGITSFTGLYVNDILFFTPDGNLFYGRSADYENGSEREPSDELVRYIQDQVLVKGGNKAQNGIVPLSTGPVLIASQPVLMSNELGPSRGIIVFGRELDDDRIAYLSGYTLYPFSLEKVDIHPFENKGNDALPVSFALLNRSSAYIKTSSLVYDISNNPSYVALMDIPYYSPYRAEVVNLIALLVIGLSLIFFAVIFYYYRYFFAGHITNLSQMLDEAARCGTSSNTISRTGPLEISRLSESAERVTSSLIKNRDDLNRSREERDETEERWQVLFEEAIDAMCVGDDEGIINANISWVRLFGCLRAEVVSVPLNILSLPMLSDGSDPMTLLIEKYNQVPDDGSNRFDWRVSHDGQELVFDVTIKRIRYKGDFLRFIVARDITLQRSMQDEQARAIARIDQTMVQLATLNDEIRNPLTIISGLVDIHEFNQADAILGQIKKIDAIIDRLDKGYLDSEKVRNYLKKYFEIGNR